MTARLRLLVRSAVGGTDSATGAADFLSEYDIPPHVYPHIHYANRTYQEIVTLRYVTGRSQLVTKRGGQEGSLTSIWESRGYGDEMLLWHYLRLESVKTLGFWCVTLCDVTLL